jgi:hypothetical protein
MRIFSLFLLLTCTSFDFTTTMDFKPERVSKCASIKLDDSIEKVFPLFGPIREKDWAHGWDPEIIYPASKEVEANMIFRTKARDLSEEYYTWVITQFLPDQYQIEYTVSTPNRIWFIGIECSKRSSKTIAKICYTYTSLTPRGTELNRDALKRMYVEDLKDWQHAINYYLKNGRLLEHH